MSKTELLKKKAEQFPLGLWNSTLTCKSGMSSNIPRYFWRLSPSNGWGCFNSCKKKVLKWLFREEQTVTISRLPEAFRQQTTHMNSCTPATPHPCSRSQQTLPAITSSALLQFQMQYQCTSNTTMSHRNAQENTILKLFSFINIRSDETMQRKCFNITVYYISDEVPITQT